MEQNRKTFISLENEGRKLSDEAKNRVSTPIISKRTVDVNEALSKYAEKAREDALNSSSSFEFPIDN